MRKSSFGASGSAFAFHAKVPLRHLPNPFYLWLIAIVDQLYSRMANTLLSLLIKRSIWSQDFPSISCIDPTIHLKITCIVKKSKHACKSFEPCFSINQARKWTVGRSLITKGMRQSQAQAISNAWWDNMYKEYMWYFKKLSQNHSWKVLRQCDVLAMKDIQLSRLTRASH